MAVTVELRGRPGVERTTICRLFSHPRDALSSPGLRLRSLGLEEGATLEGGSPTRSPGSEGELDETG
jgi:hypothetical protein